MTTLVSRFAALPRSAKWLTYLVLFVAFYFGVMEPAMVSAQKFNADADRIAASLAQKAQVREKVSGAANQIEQLTGLLGQPTLPSDLAERDSALHKRINAIFSEHRVQGQKAVYKDPVPLATTDVPASLIGPKQRLDRLAVELTFETDIPTFMAIMQALERAPEVCAVTKVNVRKMQPPGNSRNRDRDGGPVQINITAETWALATVTPNTGGRPGGAARSNSGGGS